MADRLCPVGRRQSLRSLLRPVPSRRRRSVGRESSPTPSTCPDSPNWPRSKRRAQRPRAWPAPRVSLAPIASSLAVRSGGALVYGIVFRTQAYARSSQSPQFRRFVARHRRCSLLTSYFQWPSSALGVFRQHARPASLDVPFVFSIAAGSTSGGWEAQREDSSPRRRPPFIFLHSFGCSASIHLDLASRLADGVISSDAPRMRVRCWLRDGSMSMNAAVYA